MVKASPADLAAKSQANRLAPLLVKPSLAELATVVDLAVGGLVRQVPGRKIVRLDKRRWLQTSVVDLSARLVSKATARRP
jgi:hypothetical protein